MTHNISDKIMRGEYVSKAECFEHAEEVERTMAAYGPAMAAFEAYERKMRFCCCDYDIGWNGNGVRIPNPTCPVDHEEEDSDV